MIVFQRAGYDFLLHHNVLKEFKDVMKKYENLRDRLGNKIGTLETKNGYTITGKEIFQILASSMWGYCMEESKEGRFLTQENKEIFKEIFTSFIKE
ncbi:MAG: hypothetical protein NTX88_08585 [Candidatus Atribacteria bacterium]|nr:hypothetical protein [Candidatus Atribacteria bacterium]